MPTNSNTDLADRAKSQRDAAMEIESATLRNWLSSIIAQKEAIAESGNNLVSINKPREVTIDVSLPIASDVEQKKSAPSDPRRMLPESVSGGRIPTGCPYDLKLGVNEDTESWVSVHKHTGCSPTGVGNGVFERYATIFSNVSESGLWAYFGKYADFNLKSIVKSDQASYRLYNIDSSSYFGSLVKSSESSLWGYSSEQFNYKIKSDGSKSDIVLWAETGNGYTSSMWATASQAGLKLEDNLGNSSFLDTGNIWLKFDGGNDYTHGYPGYLRLQYTSGAYSNLYGGGLYINDSENWVQINPPDNKNAYFQKVLLGDLSQRWVLCSEASSGEMTCDSLSNPLVKNIKAKRIESHISPLNICGSSATYLDLVDSFFQVAANGATTKVTIEPDTIWVSDPDQSLSVEPNAINIVSSAGSSEFSDTYLHVSRDLNGSYASFDGKGWLQLRNPEEKEVYLDPDQLVFTDEGMTSTHNAEGFTAKEGSDSGELNSQELWMTLGGVGVTKVLGGSVQINKDDGGRCTIEPPANTTAYFQKLNYVDTNLDAQEITVLTTTPIPSGVIDTCTKIMGCVRDSKEFPTWDEANKTYVDWDTLKSYPTWSEVSQNYVDWTTFSALEAFVGSRIMNALLGLGVDASCDANGNITVNLTGLPSTSSNTPFPSGPTA